MKNEIKLIKKQKEKDDDYFYIQQYENWRNILKAKDYEAKFFIIYKDFEIHLRDIPPGPLKLYLFYGFHAKNDTGLLWYGIEKISEYFKVSERTIINWNKELEDRGLIARILRESGRNKMTYILPFSLNFFNTSNFDDFSKESFSSVYGNQYKAFHLFQWRKKAGEEEYSEPYNILIVVYKKGFVQGNYNHYTAFKVNQLSDEFDNTCINQTNLADDIYVFDSSIEFAEISTPIQGIAVNTRHNLRNKPILYKLMKELLDIETDFSQYESVSIEETEE